MSAWQRIKAALTRAPVSAGGASAVAVVPALPLWQQYQRIGGNLTPATVSSILYEADTGVVTRLVDLANEARQKDGHLQSNLHTRETALSNLGLTVAPFKERGRKEPKKRDAKVAGFVQDAVEAAAGDGQDVRGFQELVAHLQGGVYHGFAVAETAWRKHGSDLTPAGWRLINQRRFRFRSRDGRLVWRDPDGAGDGVDLQATYPGQFVVHMPRVNGDAPAREGLSRLLVWSALFRNWTVADWLKLAEMSWKPWRVGRYSLKANDKDRQNLLDLLEKLTTNGVGLVREDHKLDVHWPPGAPGGRSNHRELCEFMGSEMSKAVLGQTLTTEQGEKGARSLGEVHDAVRKDIRQNDAASVFSTVRRDVFAPLVGLNFGDVPVPAGGFNTDDAADLGDFATALKTLREAGLRVPEAWAYDEAGIPEPTEGDRVLGEEDADLTGLDDGPPNEPEPDPQQEKEDGEA